MSLPFPQGTKSSRQVNENDKDTAPWSTWTPQMPSPTCGKGPHPASSNSSSGSHPYSHEVASEGCSHKFSEERGELQSNGEAGLRHQHSRGRREQWLASFLLVCCQHLDPKQNSQAQRTRSCLKKRSELKHSCAWSPVIINTFDRFSLKGLSG